MALMAAEKPQASSRISGESEMSLRIRSSLPAKKSGLMKWPLSIVLPVNKLMDRYRPEPKPAPTKECPECLSAIPALDLAAAGGERCIRLFKPGSRNGECLD